MANLVPTASLEPLLIACHAVVGGVPLLDLGVRALRAAPLERPVSRVARVFLWTTVLTLLGTTLASPWIHAWSGARPFFLAIRVVDIALFVVAPVVGAIAILSEIALVPRARRTRRAARIAATVAVLGAAAASLEGHWFGPNRLTIERVSIKSDRVVSPIRIALIADLQTDHPGRFERRVIDAVNALKPDLVLFLGDYYQDSDPTGYARDLPALRALWDRVSPGSGTFAVRGDFEDRARVDELFRGTRVRPLLGARHTVAIRGQRIHLYGYGNGVLLAGGAPSDSGARRRRPATGSTS